MKPILLLCALGALCVSCSPEPAEAPEPLMSAQRLDWSVPGTAGAVYKYQVDGCTYLIVTYNQGIALTHHAACTNPIHANKIEHFTNFYKPVPR
jgi:hypothetical protein